MEKKDLRVIFMGTPEFAVETLRTLVDNGYQVVAVVTQPDRPVGRHQNQLQPPAVKQYAMDHGLPVLQPEKMKDPQFLEALAAFRADVQVVVAFRMLPEVVWTMPQYGTFNVHAALLPKYRGAAPINWAIINGESTTGVTTFFLDENIDTGRIILQRPFPLPDDADVEYVYDGLMRLGAEVALETLDRLIAGNGHVDSQPQTEPPVYDKTVQPYSPALAPKLFKDTCRIDWNQTAKRVYDFIRGLSPVPVAWTQLHGTDSQPQVLKIYRAAKTARPVAGMAPGSIIVEKGQLFVACTDYLLSLLDIQLSGKRRMAARYFLNGSKPLSHVE